GPVTVMQNFGDDRLVKWVPERYEDPGRQEPLNQRTDWADGLPKGWKGDPGGNHQGQLPYVWGCGVDDTGRDRPSLLQQQSGFVLVLVPALPPGRVEAGRGPHRRPPRVVRRPPVGLAHAGWAG